MRIIRSAILLPVFLALPPLLTGCAQTPAVGEARMVEEVLPGVVTEVLPVAPANPATSMPPTLQITIHLDSGRLIAITEATPDTFRPGDRVQVLSGNGITRVTH